jgi:RimJ/RimL family protein N-acetyltransferase
MNYWQGSKIRLRALEPGDAPHFHAWNQDSERARHLDFVWPPQSLAAVQAWTQEQSLKRMENDCFHWVIENEEGQPCGTIATLHCSPRDGSFSYAIDVAADQRRRGYASEAVRLILRYYFDELRYQKATVTVHSDNEASIRLHERLGFQLEGRLRRTVFNHGRYLDMLYYGITVEEFHAQEGKRNKIE